MSKKRTREGYIVVAVANYNETKTEEELFVNFDEFRKIDLVSDLNRSHTFEKQFEAETARDVCNDLNNLDIDFFTIDPDKDVYKFHVEKVFVDTELVVNKRKSGEAIYEETKE